MLSLFDTWERDRKIPASFETRELGNSLLIGANYTIEKAVLAGCQIALDRSLAGRHRHTRGQGG